LAAAAARSLHGVTCDHDAAAGWSRRRAPVGDEQLEEGGGGVGNVQRTEHALAEGHPAAAGDVDDGEAEGY
jgi:hypothetical protein